MSLKKIQTEVSVFEDNTDAGLHEQPYYFNDVTIERATEILMSIREVFIYIICF